jgi:hypothetical protein
MRHWSQLARRQRARRTLSIAILGIRERSDQTKQGAKDLLALVASALTGVAAALLLVVVVEAIAALLNHFFHWGSLFRPVSSSSYETFVGAAVGAQATFLALFFTTVGVIASTAYARVPGEIRQLFVRERTSTIYVWNVVFALVVGITLLALPVVSGYQFRALVVVLFALLSLFSVLSLVILGRRLFNFFDPSALTERIYPEFVRAVRGASAAGEHVPDDVEQKAAHDRAARFLRRYEQLVTLIAAREIQDSTAPQKVAYQLLGCWRLNSALKSSIPAKSEWFHRTPSHPNWLTMEHNQLSTALETRTGIQPTLVPDPLWIERRFSSLVGALLPSLGTTNEWGRLISVIDAANELIFELAKRLQVEEAFLLLKTIGEYRRTVLVDAEGTTDISGDRKMFRLALAEREVLGFTSLWLGLARPFEFLNLENLTASFDTAVESLPNAYKAGAPRDLLSLFEDIASGIAFERKVEHERITPDWWVHHLCGRVYAATIKDAVCTFVDEVEATLVASLVAEVDSDPETTAVRIFDLLELLHKIEFHLQTVHAALDSLQTLRHEPSADELWPDAVLPDDKPRALEEQLLVKLGTAAVGLPSTPHDESTPDLFGQAYRRLFDATFHAIVEGRDEIARQLLPITIAIADRARQRLVHDLAGERMRQQAIFGTEPLVDMMELSGYALLMSLVSGAGIWPTVRAVWDSILDAGTAPELARQLTAVLTLQENVFALTSGGVGRTSRQMELTRILTARGIVGQAHLWGEPHTEPHHDPIVATFAPDGLMGIHHDLADLFLVEYLALRPDLAGLEIPRGAEMLRESIEHQRRRARPPEDDEGGTADDA